MADIPSSPNIIQQEEVAYKAAVSEATFTRIGASINYIISRIYNRIAFEFAGRHNDDSAFYGMAGIRYFYRPVKIDHYYFNVGTAGSGGTLSINFQVYDETNTLLGNLFSTAPALASSAGSRALIGRDVTNSTDIEAGAGKTVGTLNYTQFPAGYSIKPFFPSVQTDGENAFFELVVQEL